MPDSVLFEHEHEHLWQVEEYSATIRKKTIKAISKERERAEKWKQTPPVVFDSEGEAVAFVLARAEKAVQNAEDELGKRKGYLHRLREKHGVASSSTQGAK